MIITKHNTKELAEKKRVKLVTNLVKRFLDSGLVDIEIKTTGLVNGTIEVKYQGERMASFRVNTLYNKPQLEIEYAKKLESYF